MTKSLTTNRWGCALVLVGALLGACGDDDDDSSGAGGGGAAGASAGQGGGGAAGDGGAGQGGAGTAGTGGAAGAGGPALSELGTLTSQATCEALEGCLGFAFKQFAGGQCEAVLTSQFEQITLPTLQQAIERGTVVYDGTRVQACLDALKAAGCSSGATYRDVCEQAVKGTVPTGGECAFDVECEGQAACDLSTCPGKCAPRSAEGKPCLVTDQCQDGLACNLTTKKCVPPAATGADCGKGVPCNLDAICIGEDASKGTLGKCKLLTEYYSAGNGFQCDLLSGPTCAEGLACAVDDASKGTTKCVPLAATGAACKFAIPDACQATDYCDGLKTSDLDSTGTCKTRPAAGEPCAASALGPTCAAGLVCDDKSVCRAQLKNGEACTTNGLCISGLCAGGTCSPPAVCVAP